MRHKSISVTGRSPIKGAAMSRRLRTLTQLVGVLTVLSVLGLPGAPAALAAESFTVNSVDDLPDLLTGDGLCLTPAGTCSLRAAIIEANVTSNPAMIGFDIPGPGPHLILVGGGDPSLRQLPKVTSPTTIDATTEPDYLGTPVVELRPNPYVLRLFGGNGLRLDDGAEGSLVRGLAITFFLDAIVVDADNATIEANYLGVYPPERPSTQAEVEVNKQIIYVSVELEGNWFSGVYVSADDVVIGGPDDAQQNVISNNGDGIFADFETDRLVIENNLIGTDPSGSEPRGNSDTGIYLSGGSHARIVRNVVSGNGDGIVLDGAQSSEITGNLIGTDATGLSQIGNENRGIGIDVFGPSDSETITPLGHQIGGPAVADRNVVAANGTDGISLIDSSGVTVENNYIGLNAAGEQLGNLNDGFWCSNCTDIDVIGNVISGNGDEGIHVRQDRDFLAHNVFQSNLIGTDPAGEAVSGYGNTETGVQLEGASGNLFGGTTQDGNVVAQSGQGGILIHERVLLGGSRIAARANTLSGNKILQNEGPGTDLGNDGVTANDAGDVDGGANLSQNYPLLSRVFTHGKSTRVEGSLESAPGTHTVELFVSSACDPSGFGEGAVPFTSFDVAITLSGANAFSIVLHHQLSSGAVVTGMATDGSGNTSEFSACAIVDGPRRPTTSAIPATQPVTSTDSEPPSEDEHAT